jgi:CRISPR-associated protein Cmr4
VDNTIVREPATDLPKIPGTSLAGTIRAYTTIALREDAAAEPGNMTEEKEKKVSERIIRYFGDTDIQGMVRFHDAEIVLFPVASIKGTVWITTRRLCEYWMNGKTDDLPGDPGNKACIIKWDGTEKPGKFNLGWLLLETAGESEIDFEFLPSGIIERIAILPDRLFSGIVNDNLEVRTSVKIDPETGAAEKGALFTYEAIPRGTVLGFKIIVNSRDKDETNGALNSIEKCFPYLEILGVGGMGTRGFGRIQVEPLDSYTEKVTEQSGSGVEKDCGERGGGQ